MGGERRTRPRAEPGAGVRMVERGRRTSPRLDWRDERDDKLVVDGRE